MSKFRKYSYVLVLIVTIFIMTPFMIYQMWHNSVEAEQAEDNMETNQAVKLTTPDYDELLKKEEKQPEVSAQSVEPAPESEQKEEEQPEETPQQPVVREFTAGDATYFDDALFIGDSRMVGFYEYGTLKNAVYYADTGMSVGDLYKEPAAIPGGKDFETVLSERTYGKVYIMLGINEVGNNRQSTMEKYIQLVTHVKEKQPSAIIYILSNLHVSARRAQKDAVVNNANIDSFNQNLAALADGQSVFYLDINELFDDGQGNLREECTSDGTHVLAKYYQEWSQWLCERTIAP